MFRADVADERPRATDGDASTQVPDDDPHPTARRADGRAGRVLSRATLVPALLAVSWVLAAFPLAATGAFRPWTVVPLAVVVAAVLVPLGLSLTRRPEVAIDAPWWSVVATGVVGAGFAAFTALSHDEHVVPRRDAGSYAQIAYWLAHHGGLTYRVPTAAFGPSPGDLGFASPAFYQHGDLVIPQFMTGWPSLLAGADWLGGWGGMMVLPAVIGGFAIITVGGLAARLIGPRWAPVVAALTGLAWPVLRVAQETLSEPVALLLLAAGACLLLDLVAAARAWAEDFLPRLRRHAFATGLLLGAGELVRIDFGVDLAFILPVVGWLWLTRRPGAGPFLAGATVSGILAVLDGLYVTRPYVSANGSSVRLMLALLAAVAAGTAGAALAMRRRGHSVRELHWWPSVPSIGAGIVPAVAALLVARPYLLVDHSTTDRDVRVYTEIMQGQLGLPLDGTRGYAEQSLWWVSWYLGWPMLAAALLAATVLTWRVLHGRDLRWAAALLVYLGSSLLVLAHPGITPDHPWADRRLVVEVLPGLILFATWTMAQGVRWTRARWPRLLELLTTSGGWRSAGISAGCTAIGLAAVLALFGPELLATAPVAPLRTEVGELEASADVCAHLQPDDTVVLVDPLWIPVLRAQCGLPAAQLLHPSPEAVAQVAASIRAAGRVPVLAGSQLDSPAPLHLTESANVRLVTSQDQEQLVQRPDGVAPFGLEFWLVRL